MVLPGLQLFPHTPLPLYIFEPRYRAMLTWSLEQDRMFAIANVKPGVTEPESDDELHPMVGLGMVRACVGRQDGTSHLILQGIARMRITDILQDKPFRIASLRELASTQVDDDAREELTSRLRKISSRLFTGSNAQPEGFEQHLEQIEDPSVLSDVLAHACLRDTASRQAVFEELDVARRVDLLSHLLRT